jgi:DNA-binding LacI/PurR family transcriptional regulator
MGMRVGRVARQVQSMDIDAWVIVGGSAEVLEWFEQRKEPAFAFHGRLMQVGLASLAVRKSPVISTLVGKLANYGHRRIVLLARTERRQPRPGFFERHFLESLESHGIPTSGYNIPEWEDSPEGLGKVIDSLFQVTPPTALLVGDSALFHAVQLHLAARGLFAPRDLSLFCNDAEESFHWTRPEVSHIEWDSRPAARRIVNWAGNIASGREDTRKTFIKARLYEGGTLGPRKGG